MENELHIFFFSERHRYFVYCLHTANIAINGTLIMSLYNYKLTVNDTINNNNNIINNKNRRTGPFKSVSSVALKNSLRSP